MEINICAAGFGGQGVMTLGKFLASAVCTSTDYKISFFPSYGAEQRGGTANCYVVISDDEIGSPMTTKFDDLIVLNQPSLDKFLKGLKEGGRLIINSSLVEMDASRTDVTPVEVPATELALEMGNAKAVNIIMLGAYIGYTEVIPKDLMWGTIEAKFKSKPKLIDSNKAAFDKGYEIGANAKK